MFHQNHGKRQIALNIQTTGYEARRGDRIIEIAALEYIDGIATGNKFVTLVNPEGKKLSNNAFQCNQITDDMLSRAPLFIDVAKPLFDFIRHDELIVHNCIFVATFIDVEMALRQDKLNDVYEQLNHSLLALKTNLQEEKEALPIKGNKTEKAAFTKKISGVNMALRTQAQHKQEVEWTTIYDRRHIIDVMHLDQRIFPKHLFNYSHALNEICYRVDINHHLPHTAENRALLTMQAYSRLNVIAERRRGQISTANAATLFAASKRNDAVIGVPAISKKSKRV